MCELDGTRARARGKNSCTDEIIRQTLLEIATRNGGGGIYISWDLISGLARTSLSLSRSRRARKSSRGLHKNSTKEETPLCTLCCRRYRSAPPPSSPPPPSPLTTMTMMTTTTTNEKNTGPIGHFLAGAGSDFADVSRVSETLLRRAYVERSRTSENEA